MTYQVIYDIAADSQAPRAAFLFGAIGLCITGVWAAWLRVRAARLHGGVKFLGVVTVLMLVLGAGLIVEQRSLASDTSARTVEGPIADYWTRSERSGRKHRRTYEWEGFSVGGVSFVYARNFEQNAFHNGGPTALPLKDGMTVRIRYVPKQGDGNQITRFELGNR